jgi:hypothetical protein
MSSTFCYYSHYANYYVLHNGIYAMVNKVHTVILYIYIYIYIYIFIYNYLKHHLLLHELCFDITYLEFAKW